MNMLTLGAAGIAAVLLAVWMKGVKAEYPAGVSHNTFKNDRYYLQCRICLRDL